MAPMKKIFYRGGDSRPASGSPPVRNASAPRISSGWERRPATGPTLKCWETSASATTLSTRPQRGPGSSAHSAGNARRPHLDQCDENDDEAVDIWLRRWASILPHIVRLGKEDNFWEHGSGPCGPCSELYFDRGEKYGCSSPTCGVGCDCDRYVEFWNIVFSPVQQ